MADNTVVIQEFLVSLGFKLEEASQKKFNNSLTDTQKSVLAVGGAFLGIAAAIGTFVLKMAESMAGMYSLSQVTHMSIANLNSLDVAAIAVGESIDGMRQAAGGFATALLMPGMQGRGSLLSQFVPNERDLDDTEKMIEFLEALGKRAKINNQEYQNMVGLAATYGLPEELVRLTKENPGALRSRYKEEKLKQPKNLEEVGKQARELEIALEELKKEIVVDLVPVLTKLMPVIKVLLEKVLGVLEKWFGVSVESPIEGDADYHDPNSVSRTGGATNTWDTNAPRSVRNNNPGNIKAGPHGELLFDAIGKDGDFLVFANESAGRDAQIKQLELYRTGKSAAAGWKILDTPESMINKWTANDSPEVQANYLARVTKMTGFKRDQQLGQEDVPRMATAMAEVERGNDTGSGSVDSHDTNITINHPVVTSSDAIRDLARQTADANRRAQRTLQSQQRNVNTVAGG